MAMATATDQSSSEDDERSPLHSIDLDERILALVRLAETDDARRHTVRPALLAAELGLSVEEATRELCGLLSAVGGGEDGASFAFERLGMPPGAEGGAAAPVATVTTMVFTFPPDFVARARRYRTRADWKHRLRALATVALKALKICTAFGLIISLAVLIVAGICLLVAAVLALARGGGHGGGARNHPLVHRLRYLCFQLRSLLWLYALCGSAVDGNRDPFLREIAGDVACALSLCCGNPLHPFFWFRAGGMRRRWARVGNRRGWGGTAATWNADSGGASDGIAMTRRGTWGEEQRPHRSPPSSPGASSSMDPEQRGLLSIAVEFLFGPTHPAVDELEKWKFRASVILTLSSASQGRGISLRELLPYVDAPPASATAPSAVREALRIVAYFNGKPADGAGARASGMEARFCFPELVAETDCPALLATLGSAACAPPVASPAAGGTCASVLYEEEARPVVASAVAPDYLYERPGVLTELTRQHFGRCVALGLLNLAGVVWMRRALLPGGSLQLSSGGGRARRGPWSTFASVLLLKLLGLLRWYAGLFFVLPLCRLALVLLRNYGVAKRNARRLEFVRVEL